MPSQEKIAAEVDKNEELKKAMEEVKGLSKITEKVESSEALKKTKEILEKAKPKPKEVSASLSLTHTPYTFSLNCSILSLFCRILYFFLIDSFHVRFILTE
jgi:hypothetical protein